MDMAKMLRKTLVYGLMLAAGVTLGMQLSESGTTSVFGPGFQTGGTMVGNNGQSMMYPYPQQQQQQPQQSQQYSNGWIAGSTPVWSTNQGNVVPQGTTDGYGLTPGYGSNPAGTAAPNTTANDGSTAPTAGGQVMQTPADLLMPPPSPPAIDRFADKAAHLLQQASQKSIHWVASWFGPGE
jgi:hypothetical protein